MFWFTLVEPVQSLIQVDFGEFILIDSPMQLLRHTGSETVFGLKHKSSPLTKRST